MTPLDAVMVNVAVVEAVADKRCAGIGVSVKAPVVVLTDTLGELVLQVRGLAPPLVEALNPPPVAA